MDIWMQMPKGFRWWEDLGTECVESTEKASVNLFYDMNTFLTLSTAALLDISV
jgi:hypothetical protein